MIRCILSSIGLAALAIVGTVLAYEGVSLPIVGQIINGVVAGRLEGYVTLSEKAAVEAKAAEMKRQADAAAAITESYRKRESEAKAAAARAEADLEKGIASYEHRLTETKRRCEFDSGDLDVILQRHR